MDLITGLLNSKGYDAILTIIDHGCSRGAIFLPCTTTITGPQIAKLYLNHLYWWFGLPKWIISDMLRWTALSGPYQLHGPSISGVSYMLQLILRTDWTVMDCWTLPYTLSLYGHMLIIAIIVLNFHCSLLLCPIVVWSDFLLFCWWP